jgi:Zn-dependent peptidase ImmA (M78 family)/DNA-binding XRE family transcriptional regulator
MNIGGKIEKYRKRIGMTKKDLAEKLDLTPSAVTYYENGARQPSLKAVMKIAKATKVPIEYFLMEKDYSFSTLSRGKGKLSKEEQQEVSGFQALVENLIHVAEISGFDLSYKGSSDYLNKTLSDQDIGKIKEQLDLPEIVDYESLVEALWLKWRVTVFEMPFQKRTLSAVTIRKGSVYSIFINKGTTPERKLFSLAHELGHILMHLKDNEFIISRLSARDIKEKQANEFAGKFVVPKSVLIQQLNDSAVDINRPNIRKLAGFFNVSYECIVYNLAQINLVDYREDVARKDTEIEDYDYEITLDNFPPVYKLLVYAAWKNGDISISKAANYLMTDIRTANEHFYKIQSILGQKEPNNGTDI